MHKFCKVLTLIVLLSSTMIHSARAEDSWLWWGVKTAGKGVAVVGVGAAAVAAAPVVLTGAGFTAAGVAAGSLAATAQATMGGVIVSGSTFAALQSAGAAGIGLGTKAALLTLGSVVGYTAVSSVEEDE